MRRRSQYTDARKKQIVARCFKVGHVNEVAEAVGVADSNLRKWCRDPRYGGKPGAFTSPKSVAADALPTTKRTAPRKAKALVPTAYGCPHCGGPITLERKS